VSSGTAQSSVLSAILQATRVAVAERRRAVPVGELEARAPARSAPRGSEQRLRDALARPGVGVIAEFKRRSPSAGVIRAGSSPRETVGAYERGGACAISVLTEESGFGGSLADLSEARAATELPILRKDFIVDAYQLHEARAVGADAVLLIVAALEQSTLVALHHQARELGLEVLVEVHDETELARALSVRPALLGVNNRDLRDFSVDVGRTLHLLPGVPTGVPVVSESGIGDGRQLRELSAAGVSAVLVGEALMRAPDPEAALRALVDATEPH